VRGRKWGKHTKIERERGRENALLEIREKFCKDKSHSNNSRLAQIKEHTKRSKYKMHSNNNSSRLNNNNKNNHNISDKRATTKATATTRLISQIKN